MPPAATEVETNGGGRHSRATQPALTLTSQVYDRLRDDIVLGSLQPGQKLTLDVLRERYGLGMTPLREALYRLSASKLVDVEDRRGFRVAPVSAAHLAEVIELRAVVETTLLRDAFKHASVHWESQIVAAFHSLQRAADYKFNPGPYEPAWEHAHRDFHLALLSASGLPMLREFHLTLWDHNSRYRNLAHSNRAMPSTVFEGHKQLMDAAIARDQDRACELMSAHIAQATAHIMQSLFPSAGPTDSRLSARGAPEAPRLRAAAG